MGSEVARLEVELLGQFAAAKGQDEIRIGSRTAQALFAFLLLSVGSRHRRERLTALLWPDAEEENARQNLRNALWALRKALGEEALLADKLSVGFNPQVDYRLDVAVLEAGGVAQPDELMTAVAAYGGELLPGFYEEWILLERERVRALYDRKMQILVDLLVEAERWTDVLTWTERWLSFGAAPEPAYRALMIAHSSMGDLQGVANVYRRCAKTLEEELGVEPSAETQELYERCLLGHGAKRNGRAGSGSEAATTEAPTEASQPPRKPAMKTPAFLEHAGDEDPPAPAVVGREAELAWLQEHVDAALAGRGRVAFVAGEAGQGKSTLLREFSRRSQELHPKLVVALGSSNAFTGVGDPFLPFRDLLRMLLGDVEAKWSAGSLSRDHAIRLWRSFPDALEAVLEQGPELLGSFVPGEELLRRAELLGIEELADRVRRLGSDRSDGAVTGQDRSRLLDAYTQALRALSVRHPLVLILDDLHWADPSSLGLLFHLGRRLEGSSILIVAAYRPEDVAASGRDLHSLRGLVSEFEREFGEIRLDLDESSPRREFIDPLLDSEPNLLGAEFREGLARLTEGNPLFTVELLQELKDRGVLERDADGYWTESGGLAWEALPARVEGVIRTRIERLDEHLREALTVGSIEGEVFTAEVAAKVLDVETRALVRRLGEEADRQHHLIADQEVQRVAERRLSKYRFRHNLFQHFLYTSLGRVDRAYLHEAVGLALEELYGSRAGDVAVELARHFIEAGLEEKAVHYLLLAGSRSIELSAHEEAVGHLRRGLELLGALPDGAEKERRELELQLLLGSALQALQGYASADVETAYSRALRLAERFGSVQQRFSALWSLSLYYGQHARFDEARLLGLELLELAEREGSEDLLLQAHHSLWFSSFCGGDIAAAREHAEQGFAFYDTTEHRDHATVYGGHDPGTCARLFSARAQWYLGYPDQALARAEQALALAEGLTHPNSLAHAHAHATEIYLLRGDGQRAQALAEKAIALAREHGFSHWLAWGTMVRGCALVLQGDTRAGIEEIERARSMGGSLGKLDYFIALERLVQAQAERGEVKEGLELLEEAFEVADSLKVDLWKVELHRLRGVLLRLRDGRTDESRAGFVKALALAREAGAKSLELRAATSYYRAFPDGGNRRFLEEVVGMFDEGFDTLDHNEARDLLAAPVDVAE